MRSPDVRAPAVQLGNEGRIVIAPLADRWTGLIKLLECKYAYHGKLVSAPYSYNFWAEWTGLSEGQHVMVLNG